MAQLKPFRAVRPAQDKAQRVACLPYDVLNYEQACRLAEDPISFVHVIKSETDFPEGTDLYAPCIYEKAKENLEALSADGTMIQDDTPCYYIYREITSTHTQTGFVGTVSCQEYESGIIRRHELTVAEKEDDRTRHILTCRAQTGPVFLTFPDAPEAVQLLNELTAVTPVYDFTQADVRHQVWVVSKPEQIQQIESVFQNIPILYIADGHHRAASSNRAAKQAGAADTQEAGRFMAVVFPADDLSLLGYHRYVKDLNGHSKADYLKQLGECFDVKESRPGLPASVHEISMVLADAWYTLVPHTDAYDSSDSISRLDVSILQEKLLAPILGIEDPRRDKRIQFIGGEGAENEVASLAQAMPEGVGFLLYPTDIHDLIAVANDKRIMPPKSTWFEPKLLSGLFVHNID